MKRFFITAITTALAATAQAGTINLDMRADYSGVTYNDEVATPSFSKFYLKTGRLDFQTKVVEDLSMRVRWAFNKDATRLATDNTQRSLEYAYLSHKMNDMFTLSAGKFNTEFGGFEGATSGADLYLTSEFYTRTGPAGALAGENLGTTNLLYMTGVKGTFSFADQTQTLHILATNETNQEATSPLSQNTSMMGVIWKGAFMDKALMFNVSYHMMNADVVEDKHSFVAVGAMWNSQPVSVTVDYLMTERNSDAGDTKDALNSIVAKIGYSGWEQWVPRVEFTSTEEKLEIAGTQTNKFMGMGLVLEYKPYTDTNFRYHVAANQVTLKPETGDDIIRQEVLVGARLMADFLK